MARPPATETYDVFVSYKRGMAAAEARLIRSELTQRGLRVFMDVTDLGKGFFDDALLQRIAQTPNFLVILSPHALDSSGDRANWVHLEAAQAIASGRNIVPVMLPGFRFAENLPEDIAALPRYQGVEYSHAFFEATIERILELMHLDATRSVKTKAQVLAESHARARRWRIVAAVTVVLAVAILSARYQLARSREARIVGAAQDLRTQFRQYRRSLDMHSPDSPALEAAKADVNTIRALDPNNGHYYYYSGEVNRITNPALFDSQRCVRPDRLQTLRGGLDAYQQDFYTYLEKDVDLPESEKGGDPSDSDLCYERSSGHCPQRTEWIKYLLAYDLYQEALVSTDRADQDDKLSRALKFAEAAAVYHDKDNNQGFSQCISSATLISDLRAMQKKLGIQP